MPRPKKDAPKSTSFLSMAKSCDNPKLATEHMRSMFGPQGVDQQIRQAISMCWMMLPDDKKNVETVGLLDFTNGTRILLESHFHPIAFHRTQ